MTNGIESIISGSTDQTTSNGSPKKEKPPKKTTKRSKRPTSSKAKKERKQRVERPFPRVELQEAVKVPLAIRHKNGGNPWPPEQVREAVQYGKGNAFLYLVAAARDFGLTEGNRDSAEISLTELGRRLAYSETPEQERETRREAFLRVDLFRQVLEYYQGSSLPEMKFLHNTLENRFRLHPETHDEFAELFRKNCEYVGIKEGIAAQDRKAEKPVGKPTSASVAASSDLVIVAEPEEDTGLVCFVAMPFGEKDESHAAGFFKEVLNQIIAPAGRAAGFRVVTARKKGSDIIHATIVNGLLDADLVVVDLTEHNPNVLFELGVRLAENKPVALIRAVGTKPVFDVDHLLRVEEYSPCLWRSTVETDMPKIADHIRGAWDDRDNQQTYMKILRNEKAG